MILAPEQIAEIAHESIRAFRTVIGQSTGDPWEAAPPEQKDMASWMVAKISVDPCCAYAEEVHNDWVANKLIDGWLFGVEFDAEMRRSPLITPYYNLPEEEKAKDQLFINIVRALVPAIAHPSDCCAPLPPDSYI